MVLGARCQVLDARCLVCGRGCVWGCGGVGGGGCGVNKGYVCVCGGGWWWVVVLGVYVGAWVRGCVRVGGGWVAVDK
jgi:hypothetical protein